MLVPWLSLNVLHNGTAQCKKRAGQKRRLLTEEEARKVTSRGFIAYGFSLDMVTSFNYMGRVLSVADDDWPTMVQNLVKAQTVWWRMSRILHSCAT